MKKITKQIFFTFIAFTLFNFSHAIATNIDTQLSNNLKGKLLLAVEDHGRIYYVNPNDTKKYEVTFANALNLFERLAIGITNENLNKISLSTDNITNSFGKQYLGKLFLQVEDHGRIWYVDMNGKRHEVTWDNLMDLFTSLALGITNENLAKIKNSEIEQKTEWTELPELTQEEVITALCNYGIKAGWYAYVDFITYDTYIGISGTYIKDFDYFENIPNSVLKCGDYYRVKSSEGSLDMPDYIYDQNINDIAQCGGMTMEESESEECKIKCENKNICISIPLGIDCSTIQYKDTEEDKHLGRSEQWYTYVQNKCYLEDSIRMNDKNYCNMMTEEESKEECLENLEDTDSDGLNNFGEIRYGTDINNPDSDGDSYLDGEEVEHGYDPLQGGGAKL